jgi:hypothetical protein
MVGGLPGTVRAEEAKRLTAEKIEVDPIYGGEAAEPLRQASGVNKYLGHPMENTWQLPGCRAVSRSLPWGAGWRR